MTPKLVVAALSAFWKGLNVADPCGAQLRSSGRQKVEMGTTLGPLRNDLPGARSGDAVGHLLPDFVAAHSYSRAQPGGNWVRFILHPLDGFEDQATSNTSPSCMNGSQMAVSGHHNRHAIGRSDG